MLSILIPIFNTDINALVDSLQAQIQDKFPYEIVAIDDASDVKFLVNPNVHYVELKENIGRSAIRNLLANTARYDWLLYLDADTLPVYKNFIEQYVYYLNKNSHQVIFGGLTYRNSDVKRDNTLRFTYGTERESKSALQRNKNPHLTLLMSNTLIHKQVVQEIQFNANIKKYGHEDAVFSYDLFKKNISVLHIDNPVYHIGIESNDIFIEKTKVAIENLLNLHENNIMAPEVNKLLQTFITLKKFRLSKLWAWGYQKGFFSFTSNIDHQKPSLRKFDLCRLSYLCYLYHYR